MLNVSVIESVDRVNSLPEGKEAGVETEELIRRYQKGDEQAVVALIGRYQHYVYRLCYLVMRNEQDAEDMTQETFVRAFQALPRFEIREGRSFEAWLYRIAVNRCRSRMRRRWYQVLPWPNPAPQIASEPEARPDQLMIADERRSEVLEAINTLGEKHRLVVILRYYAGLSNEEIAQSLKIPSGTVRSRLYTARQRLKKLLVEEAEQEDPRIVSNRVAP
jgi:RNA polymerase sigma-70 factor (ECF subfamily)